MTDFVQHSAAQALAWALVHFLWQGAAIGLAVFLIFRVVRSASARYAIGVGALAAMLSAPAGTFLVIASQPASSPAPAAVSMMTTGTSTATTAPAASGGPVNLSSPATPFRMSPEILAIAVIGWFAGVGFFSIRLLGGWVVARRLGRRAVRPASDRMQALARQLCDRLQVRRAVRVLESSTITVPVMVGWLKPAIVLPLAALASLTPTQMEALLAHELAHVRRHDYLVNVLQSVAEALLFYHPAVWWLSRQVRAERELCCDDLAVGVCDRLVYATALTDLAAMASPGVALAATDGNLVSRVRRILGQTEETASIRAGVVPALALALVAGIAVPVALASGSATADPAVDQAQTTLQLVGQVAVADPGIRPAPAFDDIGFAQTPEQQADRQKQIEELRRRIVELQQQAAQLQKSRPTGADPARLADLQSVIELQQKRAAERQQEVAQLLEKATQAGAVDQQRTLARQQEAYAAMLQDLAKSAREAQGRNEAESKQALALVQRTQPADVEALQRAYDDSKRNFEAGLTTEQQLQAAEAALKRALASGNLQALAAVDLGEAKAQLDRSKTLFEKGLMTEQQMRDAEMALRRAQAGGSAEANAQLDLQAARAQLERATELVQKGLTTQRDVESARLQVAELEKRLKETQPGSGSDAEKAQALHDKAMADLKPRAEMRGTAVRNPFAEGAMEAAANQNEPIKAGDVLKITVTGEPDLPSTYHVSADGTIRLPFLSPLKVTGLTAPAVRAAVGKQLSERKLGSADRITVTLMRQR